MVIYVNLARGHGTMSKTLHIQTDRFSEKEFRVFTLLAALSERVRGINRIQAYELLLRRLQTFLRIFQLRLSEQKCGVNSARRKINAIGSELLLPQCY